MNLDKLERAAAALCAEVASYEGKWLEGRASYVLLGAHIALTRFLTEVAKYEGPHPPRNRPLRVINGGRHATPPDQLEPEHAQ